MKYPTVFINHGGGPLPLMGRQPNLFKNMQQVATSILPEKPPSAIVVLSAHWESDPISITSSPNPSLYFDYHGFPRETYDYVYPVPGDPELAKRIQTLLAGRGLASRLDEQRGLDHGVFVPLMIMYPSASIPVVQVSLHASLDAQKNIDLGSALAPLRDDDILIIGSGYTFHNMNAFFNPSPKSVSGSRDFNVWLKSVIMMPDELDNPTEEQLAKQYERRMEKLRNWEQAPGARISHPREEHLLPLFMVAAAGGELSTPQLIYDTTTDFNGTSGSTEHAVTGYMFV